MNNFKVFIITLVLLSTPIITQASWTYDIQVTKLSSYQDSTAHFVWFSTHPLSGCEAAEPTNPVSRFYDSNPGGKAMLSILLTALTSNATVDVDVNGCHISEVYIKNP